MHILELILDGFKSYPVRTTISGFDPSFNAVTGLNGSGKSNILDAICFVLGITNLSAVRATNLQDLIYKRGQAGVTKASVTVVFDNRDKTKAPVGFEQYAEVTVTRQILMGGATKYLINGHRSTQNSVQNLFQSVQLNINNPNFLIMQGKITKVLNMKPQEILGMIEEAAGTSMFEERKDKAVKTMAKKDKKMEEIQELLREEIEPKLNRLREEKRTYLAFQQNEAELEILTRLCIAWDHSQATRRLKDIVTQMDAKTDEIQTIEESRTQYHQEIKTMEDESTRIKRRMEAESKKGGKVEKMENRLKEIATDLARLKTQVELSQNTLKDEQGKLKDLTKAERDLTIQLDEKKTAGTEIKSKFADLKSEFDLSSADLKKAEELLQTLVTGLTTDESEGANAGGYMGQLAEARQQSADLASEAEQAKAKIGRLNIELKEKEPRLENAKAQKAKLEMAMEKMGWDENIEVQLRTRRSTELDHVRQLSEQVRQIRGRLSQLDFTYSDPVKNFDRRKVKGLVAQLITVDPSSFTHSTALEVCAGGRLYNVVVEDNVTASQILDGGRLARKVTMIPLNQIRAFVASAAQLTAASTASNGSAQLALNLIGYDDDVSKAMEFVFGNTLICPDADTAKTVTFNRNVKMKSVTLDGDIYDPSGTLSGGSKPSTSGILVKVQELKKVEDALKHHQANLDAIETEWHAAKTKMATFNQTKKDLDLKTHEITLLEERVKESNATRIISEVTEIKSTLAELNKTIVTCKEKQKASDAECKRLQKEMDDFKNNRDSKLKEIKADITRKKANVSKTASTVKAMQRDVQGIDAELDGFRKELAAMEKAKEEISKAVGRVDSDIAAVQHKLDLLARERKGAQDVIDRIEHTHEWVEGAKKLFGEAGGEFDFSVHRMKEKKVQLERLEADQHKLKKKVNPKVLHMIDSVEKREKDLKTMHTTVIKDKGKIEETIARLDEYKLEALTKAWQIVNGEFGQIFDTLLPGNWCELQPTEGKTISQGLEVRVRLGSTWKSSLTELSGGQRSLIALSLIMSLLKTHPSPIYVLDEVDAALDLQHTQNLGLLFKHRFKGSQFIVVSLKEGLFTNANVLFRTRFRDGTSVVERTVSRSASALYANDKENVNGSGDKSRRR
ncbi:uncharacterized protein MELLADRAFT_74124 [Melampsora larici-populina 98AG31]|uniref:SMC hinge domain-containing protein n=1 Tax=Melampsora larici-populina (strain 98AG31 / pathotype 3-4-7) TaxID=747676 RepID=F4R9B7_MELLP|nr:uncharacterized protein MELLADRAFT_74124 [Melampsora larici-populina 98AG31]EGG11185.1 hypothetical protein MELLADRAFT_74124 [Melampsora larici-populina 98AG31]